MTVISASRANSRHVVPVTNGWSAGVQATGRWQDKSRDVRPGRLAGKGEKINSLA
jgi:hypothetical protein